MSSVVLASDRFEARSVPDPASLEVMFRFLGTDVRVVSANVGLVQHWVAVYGAFRAPPGPAAIAVHVHGDDDGPPAPGRVTIETEQGRRIWRGDEVLVPPLAAPPLDRWLYLEGTAVCRAGQAVLLVGDPGAGKTLLALTLVARGLTLLADGLLPVDPHDLLLAPFPKAVRLRREGLALLSLEPAHPALTPFRTWSGTVEWQADTRLLLGPRSGRSAAEVQTILFLQHASRGEEPRLSRVGPDEALRLLRARLAQPPTDAEAAHRALAKLCRRASAHSLTTGALGASADLVDELLGA